MGGNHIDRAWHVRFLSALSVATRVADGRIHHGMGCVLGSTNGWRGLLAVGGRVTGVSRYPIGELRRLDRDGSRDVGNGGGVVQSRVARTSGVRGCEHAVLSSIGFVFFFDDVVVAFVGASAMGCCLWIALVLRTRFSGAKA
jgi:hypothetical protein